jgi:BioD-like phosphotransacetylase family protein
MARSVCLTAIEPGSGKSVVALGMMESLSRLGYFRPIVPSDTAPDNDLLAVSPAHATCRRAGRLVLRGPRCMCS